MSAREDPDASMTLFVGAIVIALLVLIVICLQALYYWSYDQEFSRKVVAQEPQELHSLRAKQIEKLGSYKMIDPQAGLVVIPIERAMELVVEESGRGRAPAPTPAAAGR